MSPARAVTHDGAVVVWRPLDCGHPSWIAVPPGAWKAFVAAVKDGKYDRD